MDNQNFSPSNNLNSQSKDNNFQTQKKAIFDYLQNHNATASMIAKALDIPQKNICRHKRNLENLELLRELYKAPCKETGHRASYLSTNPKLFAKTSTEPHKDKLEG